MEACRRGSGRIARCSLLLMSATVFSGWHLHTCRATHSDYIFTYSWIFSWSNLGWVTLAQGYTGGSPGGNQICDLWIATCFLTHDLQCSIMVITWCADRHWTTPLQAHGDWKSIPLLLKHVNQDRFHTNAEKTSNCWSIVTLRDYRIYLMSCAM